MHLIESGLDYTVIHPGGLLPHHGKKEPAEGGKRELLVSVDDKLLESETRVSDSFDFLCHHFVPAGIGACPHAPLQAVI